MAQNGSDSDVSDVEEACGHEPRCRHVGHPPRVLAGSPDPCPVRPNRQQDIQSSSSLLHGMRRSRTTSTGSANNHLCNAGDEDDLPAVLSLNVGGHLFVTRLSTLRTYPDSMLATMFSGRHRLDKDAHGWYFIDSCGERFSHILNFLRHETLPPRDVAVSVYQMANYYGITPLAQKLATSPDVARMVVREAHRAQFPDYEGVKEKVIQTAIANATLTQIGEVIIHAFQKVFTPRAPYFNPQHECIADAAQVIVGPWDATADEEVLIRCLEHDLLAEGFHIKQHEQRRRCKYYNGQNCQKSTYKITFYFT